MTEQLISVLTRHPWVGSAQWDRKHGALLVRPTADAVAVRPAPGALVTEYLEHWRHVYEFVYSSDELRHGDDLDLSGWRASDTGAPFSREHMLEWIEHAVGLVYRGNPQFVLEIGCGSGLLVHRLHTFTRGYVGLDPAGPVVQRLRARQLSSVSVVQAAAHHLTDDRVTAAVGQLAPHGRPDCILLNSVTQCFPDERYLTAVLDDALDLVAPGGTVVIGDIRNLATAYDFARWLEQALGPGRSAEEIDQRAAARVNAEEELLCDPRLFADLARRHPRSVRATYYAKPMRADTELTRYRYDVVLTVDASSSAPTRTILWRDLPARDTAGRLRALADSLRREVTLVTGIPNALLDRESADAVEPARLAAVLPADYAVLLDSADGRLLAAGRPAHQPDPAAWPDGPPSAVCNNPFARYLWRRMPEVLTDYLELLTTAPSLPPIAVVQESSAA